jgi:hypothetical protein
MRQNIGSVKEEATHYLVAQKQREKKGLEKIYSSQGHVLKVPTPLN